MKLPKHIGFIMDGNGRWAKLKGKPRTFGHSKGSQTIRKVVEKCFNLGIENVSLYAFSTETKDFTERTLNIAINYGSRTEIIQAINQIIKEGVTEIDEKSFSKYLYTKDLPDVDLVVRTSGESRLSNFLLYQSAYAELYFTDVLWPDFDGNELVKAIEWFNGRERRYGKIK